MPDILVILIIVLGIAVAIGVYLYARNEAVAIWLDRKGYPDAAVRVRKIKKESRF